MDALISTRRRSLMIGALGACALAGCGERRPAAGRVAHVAGATMGTTYNLKIADAGLDAARLRAAHDAVHAALDGVDRGMSLYRADSELARFNAQRAGRPLALSGALFEVLATAQDVAELSGGAFDVTVEPLVELWGFGPDRRRGIPPAAELQSRRPAVGRQALRLDRTRRTATKLREGVRADLGGIAKGYGVELAARALDAAGIEHYMIEAGGEVRARGRNGEGRPWQIGIERPDAAPPRAHYVVALDGRAMATSGDYRNYFEVAGKRYSHEIDPASGFPIDHRLASATVVADDCTAADALATALIVLGPERGWALATERRLAAYFIERDADGSFSERATPAFAALGGARV